MKLKFFELVDNALVDWLLENCKCIYTKKDEVILKQGDSSKGIYIVIKGSLSISLKKSNISKIIAHISSGDIFGEISFFGNLPIITTVKVIDDANIIFIEKDKLDSLIKSNSTYSSQLYRAICILISHKLISTNNELWQNKLNFP